MSIYENRDTPAYADFEAPLSYCDNKYIKNWWNKHHDSLIYKQIKEEKWYWPWSIADILVKNTSEEKINKWKESDPLCKDYAWYNVLMYFAVLRAKKKGFLNEIKIPNWKICHLCNQRFLENSLPYPLIQKIGINNINYCSPCLSDSLLKGGNDRMKKRDIIKYIKDLVELIEKVPSQSYVQEIASEIKNFNTEMTFKILTLLKQKPSMERVKSIFKSWLKALIDAEILEDNTRKTSRGIQCIAKDGHICLSLGEKTIDDILYNYNISHSKEPPYPEGNYRGDFKINDIIVEYFGLVGNPDYDKKIEIKRNIAKRHSINLIEIFPEDLIDTHKLLNKISAKINLNNAL